MKIKGEMEIERIEDSTILEDDQKAKVRMGLCVMNAREAALYAYNPNAARGNGNPGYPCEEYGEMDKD